MLMMPEKIISQISGTMLAHWFTLACMNRISSTVKLTTKGWERGLGTTVFG